MGSGRKLDFAENLARLPAAFRGGWEVEPVDVTAAFKSLSNKRVTVLGSGASRTLAIIAEKALRSLLNVSAWATAPLSLSEQRQRFDAALLFSASGDNVDARSSADVALAAGYDPIIVFTQNPEAQLLDQLSGYKSHCAVVGRMRDRTLAEREGFLGVLTLSEGLGAFCKCLSLALGDDWSFLPNAFVQRSADFEQWLNENRSALERLAKGEHVVALGGYWGEPVLADLESKWVEGGLGSIEISDFRNFSHGRYINSFRNRDKTSFVLLSTPEDSRAELMTERVLSDHFNVIRLTSCFEGLFGCCELLASMLHLYGAVADLRSINVTAPVVPEEGRRLFAGAGIYPHLDVAERLSAQIAEIVQLKRAVAQEGGFSADAAEAAVPVSIVRAAYSLSVAERYHALGLDFDGTLVPLQSGDDVPATEICSQLERLSSLGVPVGIFTGRGKSVLRGLRQGLRESAWPYIRCFLYNGALEWQLDQESPILLGRIEHVEDVLAIIERLPRDLSQWFVGVDRSSFDCQVTINLAPEAPIHTQTKSVQLLASELSSRSLSVASSGRSVDVFPSVASKRRAVLNWKVNSVGSHGRLRVLCIGDRGDRTGNDFEFLSSPGGFSVDRIDWSPHGCFPVQSLFRERIVGPALAAAVLKRLQIDTYKGLVLSALL